MVCEFKNSNGQNNHDTLSNLANMSTQSFQRGAKYLQPTYLSCSGLRRISTSVTGGSRVDRRE